MKTACSTGTGGGCVDALRPVSVDLEAATKDNMQIYSKAIWVFKNRVSI